jgi:translation initiation factor 1A
VWEEEGPPPSWTPVPQSPRPCLTCFPPSHPFFFLAEYSKVLRMLGNGRLEAYCFDGETRQCHIRGKMRKKVWVSAGDIILISLRDFQDGKADVILKYTADEARSLKALGQLPDSVVINDAAEDEDDGGIEFAEDSDGGSVDVDAV